ncbi:hypothetical protein V9T40_004695 [Parthenolecanium corni]|uniref:Uncharacterized protein n=1 Tax=Parthenolecanium corni TaxID=536013 RepID=A0AAN9TCR5_9HEMI
MLDIAYTVDCSADCRLQGEKEMFCSVVAQRGRKSPGAAGEEEVEVRSHDTDYTTERQSSQFTHSKSPTPKPIIRLFSSVPVSL